MNPRVASLLLSMSKVCEIADAFHSLVPHGASARWIACVPDPEAVSPHLRLETAVCTGLSFWLEAATASLRPRCCVGLAATRAALNGLAARGMVIAAMVSCGKPDPCGWRCARGSPAFVQHVADPLFRALRFTAQNPMLEYYQVHCTAAMLGVKTITSCCSEHLGENPSLCISQLTSAERFISF